MSAHFNSRALAILAGAACAFAAIAPAAAQESSIVIRGLPQGSKMEVVTYRDLNLRYISDLNRLNDRVGRAVRHVCDFTPRDNIDSDYQNCADGAWAGARPQIHRAYLRANRLAVR